MPFNERFHLMLNVAVGGNWPGEPDETTQFPVQMEVDYVRVYKCSKAEASTGVCVENRRAKRNFGMQPPEIISGVYDPEFINADVVDVYNGETVPPFATGTYISNGAIDVSEVDDPSAERSPNLSSTRIRVRLAISLGLRLFTVQIFPIRCSACGRSAQERRSDDEDG